MTPWMTLPKVELHCHLLGVINPALLARIQYDSGSVLVGPKTLQAAYPVSSLQSFQNWVNLLRPYQATNLDAMRPILAAHVSNLMAQHVRYAEIMVSPAMFPSETEALVEAFRHWREWALGLEQGYLQLEFIMVVPRTLPADKLKRDTENFIALHREGFIVGVALVGIETGESIQRFTPSIRRWREAGLGIEIHAGEHSGPESIWDALEYGFPDRLGHGLAAFHDRELLDYIRHKKIHLEFCPTSNLCTGAVSSVEQHPIGRARTLGLSFSINTDNPGAFECSLESEYQLLEQIHTFNTTDFMTVFRHSLNARFQPHLRHLPGSYGST